MINQSSRSLWLIGLVASGLLLRLAFLGGPELWYDEAFGRLILELPFKQMIAATAGDVHPPLWYALMWIWVRLTGADSEFLFRLPSVLFSLAAIPLAVRIMRRWQISEAGIFAVAVLMTISPAQIYFGQEARMYSLLQMLVLIGVLAVIERRWLLLLIAGVALLYTHNYGIFYLAALAGLVLIREWWLCDLTGILAPDRNQVLGLVALSGALILYTPWAVVLLMQMDTISSGYWIEPVTLGQMVYTLTIYLFGPFTRQFVLAAALVGVGLLTWALIKRSHKPTPVFAQIAWLTFGPLFLAVLASWLWRPLYLWRGLIGSAPFLYMLVLPPLVDLPGWKRWYTIAIVTPVLIAGLVGYALDINAFKSTTLDVITQIQTDWQDGDILYATNDGNWVMFTLYQDQPVYLMPQCEDHDRGALSQLTRQALGVPQVPLDMIPHQRAWLLWNWGAPTSACNRDRAAKIVAGLEPVIPVKSSEIQEAGVWLINR